MKEENNQPNIYGVRLITGEYIIGTLVGLGTTIDLKHPLALNVGVDEKNKKMMVSFVPLCPFAEDDTVNLSATSIAFMFTPNGQVHASYKSTVTQMTTGLVVPEEKQILLS